MSQLAGLAPSARPCYATYRHTHSRAASHTGKESKQSYSTARQALNNPQLPPQSPLLVSYLSCQKRDVLYQQVGMTQHLRHLCTVRLADVAALHLLCMMGKAQAAGFLEACSESSNSQHLQYGGESTLHLCKREPQRELLSTSYWDPIMRSKQPYRLAS